MKKSKYDKMSVYAMICPNDGLIKYIGVSVNLEQRLRYHYSSPLKCIREWIKGLRAENKYPLMRELEITTREFSLKRENYWIEKIRKEQGSLLNHQRESMKSKFPPIEYLTN